MLSKNIKTHPPRRRRGPGVKRAISTRSRGRSAARSSLTRREVEPGDLARSVRVSCAAAGWDTDDSAEPTRRASKTRADAPRRFATVSLEDGEEEKLLRRKTRLTASLVLFDRTETAANARAAEFRRTMRRVSHALACPFSREAEASRRRRARLIGLFFPVFWKTTTTTTRHDADAFFPVAGVSSSRRRLRSRARRTSRGLESPTPRARSMPRDPRTRRARRARRGGGALARRERRLRYAASEAERRRESLEGDGPRACARCVRGVPPRRPQGRGAERRRALRRAVARASGGGVGRAFFGSRDDDDDDDGRKRSEEEDVFAASMARVKVPFGASPGRRSRTPSPPRRDWRRRARASRATHRDGRRAMRRRRGADGSAASF